MSRFLNRTVIVTGAAQGIGAAYAKSLASEGARVSVCDLSDPKATLDAINEAGGEAIGFACDITDAAAISHMIEETVRKFGTIDGLVNNAAMFAKLHAKPFETISADEFDAVMQVNVRGTFECIKGVVPTMRKQKYGKIVNIASGTVFKGAPMLLHYVASKGAIIALTRAVAREVGRDGICVNCVAPGLTLSEAITDSDQWSREFLQQQAETRCLVRDQMPEDLTGIVGFLLSTASDFMTGQTVVVDGGSAMH